MKRESSYELYLASSNATSALKAIRIVSLCGFFIFVGPMLIITNSYILRVADFPYPMLLCILGLLASAISARVVIALGFGKISPATAAYVRGPKQFATRLLPVAVFMATSISSGNAAYMFLGVGIIQMLKAATPMVVLSIFALSGLEVPSARVVLSVAVISAGTLITTTGAPSVTLAGMLLMVGSMCAEAGRLACTQLLLTKAKFTVLEGQYFISPAAAAVLLVGASAHEIPHFVKHVVMSGHWGSLVAEHWHWFFLSMTLGTVINYLTFTLIQEVGSVALKVMTTVRNVLLVCHSALWMGETVTAREVGGYALTLLGFGAYSYIRTLEAAVQASTPAAAAGDRQLASNARRGCDTDHNVDGDDEEEDGGADPETPLMKGFSPRKSSAEVVGEGGSCATPHASTTTTTTTMRRASTPSSSAAAAAASCGGTPRFAVLSPPTRSAQQQQWQWQWQWQQGKRDVEDETPRRWWPQLGANGRTDGSEKHGSGVSQGGYASSDNAGSRGTSHEGPSTTAAPPPAGTQAVAAHQQEPP